MHVPAPADFFDTVKIWDRDLVQRHFFDPFELLDAVVEVIFDTPHLPSANFLAAAFFRGHAHLCRVGALKPLTLTTKSFSLFALTQHLLLKVEIFLNDQIPCEKGAFFSRLRTARNDRRVRIFLCFLGFLGFLGQ